MAASDVCCVEPGVDVSHLIPQSLSGLIVLVVLILCNAVRMMHPKLGGCQVRFRPIPAIGHYLKILYCGASLWPFVQSAAFCNAGPSVNSRRFRRRLLSCALWTLSLDYKRVAHPRWLRFGLSGAVYLFLHRSRIDLRSTEQCPMRSIHAALLTNASCTRPMNWSLIIWRGRYWDSRIALTTSRKPNVAGKLSPLS